MKWPTAPIGELVKIRGGGTPPREIEAYFQGSIPWVTPKDMKSWEITDSQIRLTREAIERSPAKIVPPNTVLLVLRSGVLKHRAPVALNRRPVTLNQDMKSLECNGRLLPDFLARYLKASEPTILSWVRATTADNYPIEKIKHLHIPVPPLLEQRRITAILDQADELRCKRRATLDSLTRLAAAEFLEFFGDPIANEKQWRTAKFGAVGQLERGISKHRPRNDPDLLGGPYPLIQTGEVTNADTYIRSFQSTYSELGLKQSRMWPAGTLCITIAANIGNSAVLAFDACFPDSVVGFVPGPEVCTEYVHFWMGQIQKELENSAPGFAQKNINLAILRELEIPVPTLDLQRHFAVRVVAIESLKALHRGHLTKLDALFASLQHRAFRGEL